MPPSPKPLRYQKALSALKEEISRGSLPLHSLFHSEREVARRFEISPLTARKVYDLLEKEGLIYRVHGKGTFIAPPTRRKQILVVLDLDEPIDGKNPDRVDFFLGAVDAASRLSREHEVVAIKARDFRPVAPDLKRHYPFVEGILFFRTVDLVLEVEKALRDAKVPFVFYGSDMHAARLESIPSRFYSEERITSLALAHLLDRGRKRIAIAHIATSVSRTRLALLEAGMVAKGLTPDPSLRVEAEHHYGSFHSTLRTIPESFFRSIDAFCCTNASFAPDVLQHLLALRIRVPEEVSVVTVDDFPFCRQIHPALTCVAIPGFRDAEACLHRLLENIAGRTAGIHDRSPVELIIRESS